MVIFAGKKTNEYVPMQIIKAKDFLALKKVIPVIDVRSPGEFQEGHIPGAFNLPLFSDDERAVVGTIYVKEDRIAAVNMGLKIVGPKMAELTKKALDISKNGQLLVHCWRGGMRSESMAWLFEKVGIQCTLLEGGYKAYRNYILERSGEIPHLIVLEGYTGSGKTEILNCLKQKGEQVLDLEGLAHHRGSVFGGIGQLPQPTTQQFQNNLADQLLELDLTRNIWVEGESQTIGRVFLPDPFWNRMNTAMNIEIVVPREARISRLVLEYGALPKEEMEHAIQCIVKRLGNDRTREILEAYQNGELNLVADKLLDYYDQTYQHSQEKYKKEYTQVTMNTGDAVHNAESLLTFGERDKSLIH